METAAAETPGTAAKTAPTAAPLPLLGRALETLLADLTRLALLL